MGKRILGPSRLNAVALTVLGVLCFLYAIFWSNFAEIHISLPFLNFPVFIGEIVFSFLLFLFLIKLVTGQVTVSRGLFLMILGFVTLVAWAILEYALRGPYALRNAALFYYPFFAVFVFYFYDPDFLNQKTFLRLTALLFFLALASSRLQDYFVFTFVVGFLIVSLRSISRSFSWLAAILGLFLFHPGRFFIASRSQILGTFIGILVALIVFLINFVSFKKRYRVLWGLFGFCLLAFCLCFFSDRNSLFSMLTPKTVWQKYQKNKAIVLKMRDQYRPLPAVPAVYHPNREVNPLPLQSVGPAGQDQSQIEAFPQRSLETAYGNMLYRIFIWEDLFTEIIQGQRYFGVGLGQPQRSPSLEILGWINEDYRRDGWITPHNSYFHFIYRAGIFGLFLVFAFFYFFFRMWRIFVKEHSFVGIGFISVLVYWMVQASFLLTLELPYTAIPFWSIFGVAWAFAWRLEHGEYRHDHSLKT